MQSPLAYVGGKSRLAKTIVAKIPDHMAYCEVFAGAGWVFFRKEPSKYEVINDLDDDLICFYRVLQNHLEEFLRQFRWLLSSRKLFEDWKRQQKAGGLTDIQRAARYYYLQRLCFGGRVKNRTFGAGPMRRPRINLLRIEEELSEVHLRPVNAMTLLIATTDPKRFSTSIHLTINCPITNTTSSCRTTEKWPRCCRKSRRDSF